MMTLTTTAFENGAPIPSKYTCDGAGEMPKLSIAGVPDGAKTLAIIMDDPDSSAGTWTHWTIWNIPANTGELVFRNLPEEVVEGKTSFDIIGYGAPCPGVGRHRYVFTLYALDNLLTISPDSDVALLVQAMSGHIVEQAQYMGTYERKENSH